MAHIKVLINNPTAGDTDGTEVSAENPITAMLIVGAEKSDETAIKCAIRVDTGYVVQGAATLKTVIDNDGTLEDYSGSNVQLAWDNNYSSADDALESITNWQNTITGAVTQDNKIFWTRLAAAAGTDNIPINDDSVKIFYSGTVEAYSGTSTN